MAEQVKMRDGQQALLTVHFPTDAGTEGVPVAPPSWAFLPSPAVAMVSLDVSPDGRTASLTTRPGATGTVVVVVTAVIDGGDGPRELTDSVEFVVSPRPVARALVVVGPVVDVPPRRPAPGSGFPPPAAKAQAGDMPAPDAPQDPDATQPAPGGVALFARRRD
jgi:hypothetical protein